MTCNPFLSISFQASFNYPSRQPSFKQNSSEADSQPDLLLQPSSSGGHLGAFINYVITFKGEGGKKIAIFTFFSTTFRLVHVLQYDNFGQNFGMILQCFGMNINMNILIGPKQVFFSQLKIIINFHPKIS